MQCRTSEGVIPQGGRRGVATDYDQMGEKSGIGFPTWPMDTRFIAHDKPFNELSAINR